MISKAKELKETFRQFFFCILCILLLAFTIFGIFALSPFNTHKNLESNAPITFAHLENLPNEVLPKNTPLPQSRNPKCSYYDCFNVYKCGHLSDNHIKVYIYPVKNYVRPTGDLLTPTISLEYYKILKSISESRYYTPNPKEACLFIPSINTLNQNSIKVGDISRVFSSLPYWQDGENHLIWNFVPGSAPDYSTVLDIHSGKALIAGAGFSSWTYRPGFDVSLPTYSPLTTNLTGVTLSTPRKWLIVAAQAHLHDDYERELATMAEIVRLRGCHHDMTLRCHGEDMYSYPDILKEATYCIIIRGARLGQHALLESMAAGCVPVIIADSLVLPFEDVIDWKRAAIRAPERELLNIRDILMNVSFTKQQELQSQVLWLYDKYFSTVEKIALTTLDIINYRVHPHLAPHYEEWNIPPHSVWSKNPLILEMTASRSLGFTAVVLTYDRVDGLFLLIQQLSKVPSLSKILVVWNNQQKAPPPLSQWPVINSGTIRLEIVRTTANKLSNRFYPYEGIETEAVLSIDDDIMMLTADEIEFGFEVWREFPDRIVGFPSRTHIWDENTKAWKYESEWRNQVSMVLTGAAFHHKYWNYLYTTAMPGEIKQWVDDHMNCEDIAMNFLVANITGKAPIKVAPRKKFKCPECANNEMLSADLQHMAQRTYCINKFTEIYGRMPLINVEFRADPVLYKDNFPEKLKRFNDIGSL